MLTKTDQLLLPALIGRRRHADELIAGKNNSEGFYANKFALYRSAKRLKDYGLVVYTDSYFMLTLAGYMIAIILLDIKKKDKEIKI